MKYSYSQDEERYSVEFNSIDEAQNEAAAIVGSGGHFWIGENTPPIQPEAYFDTGDWLEKVCIQDEYSSDWADGWDESTPEQQDELEGEVKKVMADWLDRHNLRPKFFNVENPKKFFVGGKIDGAWEIIEMASPVM